MSSVTVLIPMRNAERFIKGTLQTVLAQEGVDLDVVVVDDGSTDRSREIVVSMADLRIRVIDGPRSGISAALNAGLVAARGQYLARCDADDLYPPDRLVWQARWLDQHPDFGAVCGGFETITERGRSVAQRLLGTRGEEVTSELLGGVGRSHLGAYMIRTELLRQVGGFRTYFVMSEDADIQYRLAEVTRIWYEPKIAYRYRLHDNSITHSRREAERLFYEATAKRFLEQRRAGEPDDLQRGCPPAPPVHDLQEDATSSSSHIQGLLLGTAWREHGEGRRIRALCTGLRACICSPMHAAAWKSLAALALKPAPRKLREKRSCA